MNRIESAYRRFIDKQFLPLPTEAQIAALEGRINVAFPEQYREFLLEYNGGLFTEPVIEPTEPGCPEDQLTYLHGIGATYRWATLANPLDISLFDDNDPPRLIPIGGTPMGNLIVLAMRPEDRGTIFFKKAFDGWFFLADGIEGFFERLREPTSGEDDIAS